VGPEHDQEAYASTRAILIMADVNAMLEPLQTLSTRVLERTTTAIYGLRTKEVIAIRRLLAEINKSFKEVIELN
jgi:hypothetical protein